MALPTTIADWTKQRVLFRFLTSSKAVKLSRTFSITSESIPRSSKALVYSEYGDPSKVISLQDYPLPEFNRESVFLKMLASPINPADLNVLQGLYPIKPSLPAVGGNEGLGEVLVVGDDVKSVRVGDWVLMGNAGLGSWMEMKILKEDDCVKIPVKNGLSMKDAAMLSINPCTAYRMLKDFQPLQEGDVVLQNGANSGVGLSVIQLAAAWGLVSLNVVRDRENIDELKETLMNLGANYVFTEEEFQNVDKIKDVLKKHKPSRLALNCVGGKSSLQLLRYLSESGSMVTYGGMSKKPVSVPTSAFIFKDIQLHGFWMTRWNRQNLDNPGRMAMLKELCEMSIRGGMRSPECKIFKFVDYKNALNNSLSSFTKKSLFVVDS
ncbi:enoyl-[acyl-carrier-protein] reductase, mitochondrial-like isoform X1 [Xenia sp. Carnegie-2017]|uniref:enoyl-[acyl-carrier-protein] reductase, mitochondrial-like isoform X1 n=1 Tax=Xenia sp. Carnegie-2017 TaxID=2897299 RepID=UPI001F048B7E|nr:enoyl-[acyl-carrier-protein] reductase, mitochondrial-like isoform X1 [Xenia sp. Carnegie-2017]